MMQLLISAFAMGILGSFHCVGMCGPIAMSLPLQKDSSWGKLSGSVLYNFGRITTYSFFGLVFGLIGRTFTFFGYQQWLSILLGVLILIVLILPRSLPVYNSQNFIISFFANIRKSLGKLFSRKNYVSVYSIGLLNGLLPCGLVYMAAAVAIATGHVEKGILFMIFFGLGTLPVMWGISFFGSYIGLEIRHRIRKIYPYFMAVIACLLILRGLGLGIPYVSPKINMGNSSVSISCGNTN
jgi:uncharacterized protein